MLVRTFSAQHASQISRQSSQPDLDDGQARRKRRRGHPMEEGPRPLGGIGDARSPLPSAEGSLEPSDAASRARGGLM